MSQAELPQPITSPLALEQGRGAVVGGVQQLAVEAAGQLRLVGRVQRAVGDEHAVHQPLAAFAIALAGERPALFPAFQGFHAGAELVVRAQAEVLGVITEIAAHLAVVRVGRHVVGHGELAELGGAFGGDQVRGLVHGAVGVVDVPEPADVVVQLEADEGDSMLLQLAGRAKAHGAGADDGVHEWDAPLGCYSSRVFSGSPWRGLRHARIMAR